MYFKDQIFWPLGELSNKLKKKSSDGEAVVKILGIYHRWPIFVLTQHFLIENKFAEHDMTSEIICAWPNTETRNVSDVKEQITAPYTGTFPAGGIAVALHKTTT